MFTGLISKQDDNVFPVSIIPYYLIYYKMDSIQLSICKPRRITCNDLSAHSTLTKVLIVSVKRSIINGTPLPPFCLYSRMKNSVITYWNQDGIVSTDDPPKHHHKEVKILHYFTNFEKLHIEFNEYTKRFEKYVGHEICFEIANVVLLFGHFLPTMKKCNWSVEWTEISFAAAVLLKQTEVSIFAVKPSKLFTRTSYLYIRKTIIITNEVIHIMSMNVRREWQ